MAPGRLRLAAEPGTTFAYTDHGFATLGQIVEDISGQPLDRYLRVHWRCAVGVTRRGVSLMLHKGALLQDPEGLLVGEGRYLRQLPLEVAASHPDGVVHLVREAIAHQTDMLDDQEVVS